ncbi:MAG: hypothetical protein ACTH31_16540, partial [Pseudoclavibacter sp.]
MKSRRPIILLAAAGAVLLAIIAVGAVLWPPLAFIGLGLLQLAMLVLLLDTRRILSARVFATTAKLERLITGRRRDAAPAAAARAKAGTMSAGRAEPAGLSGAAAGAAGAPTATSVEVRRIMASRIFDPEWYEAQAEIEFDDTAAAVAHYLATGRAAGLSPHPLFDPAWTHPKTWRSATADPLLQYLDNRDGEWARSTSSLFDPVHADERLPE